MSHPHRLYTGTRHRVEQTHAAVALVFRRRDSFALSSLLSLGYFAAFLWAAQDLSYRPGVGWNVFLVEDPVGLLSRRTGPASFEAIVLLDLGAVRLLVSPVNMAIGVLVAGLVGISLGLTYLAIMQPASCGIGAGSGVFASLPALLSGTVCCGPVILIAFGIQASGLLLTAFFWLLPIGVFLLVGSLVFLAGKIDISPVSGAA